MKRWIVYISYLMLGSCASVFGQTYDPNLHDASGLDSLRQLVQKAEPGSEYQLAIIGRIAEKVGKIEADTVKRYVEWQLELSRKLNNMQSLARGLGNLGSLYERQGNYEQAFESFMRMTHIADSLNDDVLRYLSYSELGNYFLDRKDYRKAVRYSKKVLETMHYKGIDSGVTTMFNLGISYAYMGELDSAKAVFEEGLIEAKNLKLKDQIGLHLSGLSMVAYYEGDTEEGIELVREAIAVFEQTRNKGQLLSTYVTLGAYQYREQQYAEAILTFKKALRMAREVSSLSQELTITRNLSVVCAESGDFESGYYYSDTASLLADSLSDIRMQRAAKEMEAKFELGNKERDIALLREKARSDELKLTKQSQFNMALAAILLLIAIVLVVLWRNNRLRKRVNKALQLENQLENQRRIELELANQKLANENTKAQFEILKNQVDPHFMFNALNVLTSIIRSDNQRALDFVRSLSTLFRSMLELKAEHLIPLSEELKHTEAYLHLQKVRFGDSLTSEVDIDSDLGNSKYLPPFSLQQVVENAIKHNRIYAREPLHIEIRTEGNEVVVRNKLNLRNNPVQSTHTGLNNIRSRYALLGDALPAFGESGEYFEARLPLLD